MELFELEFEEYMKARAARFVASGAARVVGPALANGGSDFLQALWAKQYWFARNGSKT